VGDQGSSEYILAAKVPGDEREGIASGCGFIGREEILFWVDRRFCVVRHRLWTSTGGNGGGCG